MNISFKQSVIFGALISAGIVSPNALAVSRPSYNTGTGFFVVNDIGGFTCSSTHRCKLYDANGNTFTVHGVNSLHYDNGANAQVYLSGATAMRMWTPPNCGSTLNTTIIQNWAVNHSIVPIIADGWGAACSGGATTTGSTSTVALNSVVTNWVNNVSKFSSFEQYYLLNIANEWGPGDSNDAANGGAGTDTNGAAWEAAYESAITSLRNAGYRGPLVIDCGEFGKSFHDIIDQGQTLMNFDPQHNLIFSIHEYDYTAHETQSGTTLPQATILSDVDATGLPYMIGEFGHNADATGATTTIANDIQNSNSAQSLGWTGWAWDDDPATYGYLSPTNTTTFDGTTGTLTTWGVQIVCSSSFGLSAVANCSPSADGSSTYTKASVFGGVTNNGLASLDLYKVIAAFGISALGVLGYMLGGKKWVRLSGLSKRLQPLWRTLTERIAYLRK